MIDGLDFERVPGDPYRAVRTVPIPVRELGVRTGKRVYVARPKRARRRAPLPRA